MYFYPSQPCFHYSQKLDMVQVCGNQMIHWEDFTWTITHYYNTFYLRLWIHSVALHEEYTQI